MKWLAHVPRLTGADAEIAGRELFGVDGRATPLASERDRNFLLTTARGERYVLKVANGSDPRDAIEAQAAVLRHLASTALTPRLVPTRAGDGLGEFNGHLVRLVTYLDGQPLGETSHQTRALLQDLGRVVATIDSALATFDHPALHRPFHWDLARAAGTIREHLPRVADPPLRDLVASVLSTYETTVAPKLPSLPQSAIHNDANDHNVIVDPQAQRVVGLIDFGDMVHSQTVGGLAVAMAYAALGTRDPLAAAAAVAQGYQSVRPLSDDERAVLFGLMCTRLALSVCLAATQQAARPDDAYLGISQAGIRETLPALIAIDPQQASARLFETCAQPARIDTLLARRRARLGANVRLSYGSHPLQVVRGWMQYLYDESGRRYVDAYNNVPHVGHCHPRVVEAVVEQLATLNTNTRYLQEIVLDYADALAARFSAPLGVCFFTASGSEANELALRLARAHARQRDLIVMEGAYHGHTTTLIDISPYKHAGPGGEGAPDWVHVSPMPDVYRGRYRASDADAGLKYAREVGAVIDRLRESGRGLCGYIAETCPSVGGQIIPPYRVLAGGLPARTRGRRRLHRRRGANGLRPARHGLLGVRALRRRAGRCGAGQAHRQRLSDGRGGHDAGDCRELRHGDGVLQHVWRQHGRVCGGAGHAARHGAGRPAGPRARRGRTAA